MRQFKPKKVLVTGGAGFIGGHFIDYILSCDPEIMVVNLDLLTYAGNKELCQLQQSQFSTRYHFVHGDICEADTVNAILQQYDIDTVVHFAAESHVDNSLSQPENFIRTNVIGTQTLLHCSLSYWQQTRQLSATACRFHHISTDEVYGSLTLEGDDVFTELSPYQPNSPYSASKAAADHLVRAYGQSYGLPVVITHSSNNFGPRQHHEKFIPTVIRACLLRQSIPVYGNGLNCRDWIYVRDNCQMLLTVLQQSDCHCTYNIGAGASLSNLALSYMICDIMTEKSDDQYDFRQLIEFVKDRPGHDLRYAISMEKFKQSFGALPVQDFKSALRETIMDYIKKFHAESVALS